MRYFSKNLNVDVVVDSENDNRVQNNRPYFLVATMAKSFFPSGGKCEIVIKLSISYVK